MYFYISIYQVCSLARCQARNVFLFYNNIIMGCVFMLFCLPVTSYCTLLCTIIIIIVYTEPTSKQNVNYGTETLSARICYIGSVHCVKTVGAEL